MERRRQARLGASSTSRSLPMGSRIQAAMLLRICISCLPRRMREEARVREPVRRERWEIRLRAYRCARRWPSATKTVTVYIYIYICIYVYIYIYRWERRPGDQNGTGIVHRVERGRESKRQTRETEHGRCV